MLKRGELIIVKQTLRLIALIAACAFATPASAGWTGCFLGAHGGLAASNLNTDLTVVPALGPVPAGTSLLNIDGLSATGGMYGVHVGCDYQMNKFVLGIFGDYSWYDADFNISSPALGPFLPGGPSILNTGLDTSWSIGGRAGYLATKTTLIYGLVAWLQLEMKPITVLSGLASLPLGSTDGIAVGGGIETEIMPNIRLKLEYRYTMYDKITAPVIPTLLNLDIDPDVHTVRLGLSYAFTLGASD